MVKAKIVGVSRLKSFRIASRVMRLAMAKDRARFWLAALTVKNRLVENSSNPAVICHHCWGGTVKQKPARASQERRTISQRLRAEAVLWGFSFNLLCLGNRRRLIVLAILSL